MAQLKEALLLSLINKGMQKPSQCVLWVTCWVTCHLSKDMAKCADLKVIWNAFVWFGGISSLRQ